MWYVSILDYSMLFKLLESVVGPLDIQVNFLRETKKEALRFKRTRMADQVEKLIKDLVNESSHNGTYNSIL